MPAAGGLHCAAPDAADGTAELRHQRQVHPCLLVDLVAAGTLELEQARQQVRIGIQRDHPAHHRTDLGVEERRNQLLDEAAARDVVGIEDDDDFTLGVGHCILQRSGLAGLAVGAIERRDAAWMAQPERLDDLGGPVGRSIVDRNDAQSFGRIGYVEQRLDAVADHRFLVMGRDEHRDQRPVGMIDVEVRRTAWPVQAVDGE